MITTLLIMAPTLATTAGIGAPQFDEGSTLVLKVANIVILALAIVVLWRNAFGKKAPTETLVSPVPLKVQAHEEFVTLREFKEMKARTIQLERGMDDLKAAMHQTEVRLLEAGHEREEKLMNRINTLVPEVVRALDRTERTQRGRSA